MAYEGLRQLNLERKTISSGGTPIVQLSTINQRVRLPGIMLRAVLTIVQGAGATLISGANLSRVFQSVVLGKRIRTTGRFLDVLGWLMAGRDFSQPADVPAAAGTYRRIVDLVVPLADFDALSPFDTAPHAKMFSDETLDLAFADFAATFGANSTITGQLRPYAYAMPGDQAVVASPTRINFSDFAGGSALLPRGTFSHMVLYKEDGTALTSAEISALSVSIDGEQVVNRASIDDIACLWNWAKAKGSGLLVSSATGPIGGESLPDQPDPAAGASDAVSVPFLPILFPAHRYKMTHLVTARAQVQVDYEGTASSVRIGYRQIEEVGEEAFEKAKQKLGVPHLAGVRSKTIGKTDPSDDRARRLLPKRAVAAK